LTTIAVVVAAVVEQNPVASTLSSGPLSALGSYVVHT